MYYWAYASVLYKESSLLILKTYYSPNGSEIIGDFTSKVK